ncbi:MAG: Abi-alpha family protein [Solirubrobacterales bacterium]
MSEPLDVDDPFESPAGPGADGEASARSEHSGSRETIDDLPGLAKLTASAAWHTTEWAARSYARLGMRLLGVAARPERASGLAGDVRDAMGGYARDMRGQKSPNDDAAADAEAESTREWAALRVLGAEVMRKSRDVNYVETAHPAYERILGDLAPDEARILHLFMLNGPQPSLDVRTGGPLALLSSRLIAQGFTMIGARSGCRYPSRVPQYLNNLNRLGMIWFSRETLHDPVRYQVLEAQPEVLEAIKSVRFSKVIRRSIHLTPFGEDFCRICLAIDEEELDRLPVHAAPGEEPEIVHPPPP